MGFPESSSPGNLNSVTSGTLFEVAFLQDMLPSLAIAVTLAADAMTDFWLDNSGWESGEMPHKKVFLF